jgi:hypothetical protein
MLDGSATDFHSISSGAATQNRIVSSSTVTATVTPKSISSSVNSPSSIQAASLPSNSVLHAIHLFCINGF